MCILPLMCFVVSAFGITGAQWGVLAQILFFFFKADKDKISTRRDRQSSVFFFFSWLTDRHHTKRQQQSPPLISVNLSLSLALSPSLSTRYSPLIPTQRLQLLSHWSNTINTVWCCHIKRHVDSQRKREPDRVCFAFCFFFSFLFFFFFFPQKKKVKDFLLNDFNMPLQLCSLEFRLLLEEKLKQTIYTCMYCICLFLLQNCRFYLSIPAHANTYKHAVQKKLTRIC